MSESKQTSGKLDVFDCFRNEVIEYLRSTMPVEVVEWFRRNIDYNVPDGKPNNIMSVMDCMEILRGRTLLDDEYIKAAALEFCVELLQASRLRTYPDGKLNEHRSQHCWYAGDDIVIKDSIWLEAVAYHLLRKYFRTETYYVHLLELFQDTGFQTGIGQLVKLTSASKDQVSLSKFSLQRYAFIARKRITSFYLPVALAMHVCGVPETYTFHGYIFSPYAVARSILLRLGEYFQIQSDVLSYIGTVEVSEAMSDIMVNSRSWYIDVALVTSSLEHQKMLEENHSPTDSKKEVRVKEIYGIGGLKEQYRVYEASLKERVDELILQIPEAVDNVDGCALKREVFSSVFNKIYERGV